MIDINQYIRKVAASGLVLLVGLTACSDLEVVNPNQPDAERALAEAGDVEALISGSFGQWWNQSHSVSGPAPILANQSFMWSAWPANFGMVHYSDFPRVAISNEPTHEFYGGMLDYAWSRNYRALSAVGQGLAALEDPEIVDELGPRRVARAAAFGRFMQGMAHGSLALLYDEAFIVDETTDVADIGDAVPYDQVLEVALGFFDDAIALANQGNFDPIPSGWMNASVTPSELAQIAHSMKARYRANVARTPEERQAVNWNAVIQDVNAGVPDGWFMETDYFGASASVSHYVAAYMSQPSIGWAQASYFVFGMADQSGQYQEWLADPPSQRHPNLDSGPFLINTPDLRFPQGETEAEQVENPGMPHVLTGSPHMTIGHKDWRQPARGTYRWSYYRSTHMDFHREVGTNTRTPEITPAEMRLLAAEGHIRNNNPGAAAELINVSRTAAGLNATDAAGTNTDCVPRLPNGTCGDLMEMLKWEKRLETMVWGVHSNSWYFDGRGWGDLYAGTATTLPVPGLERELLLQPSNTFGGQPGERGSAPGSTYQYPHEG